MRVFVAGASGAIGRPLIPKLVAAGHEVTGNAKAKRELGWQPRHPSWRQGFAESLAP
jgi:uncharacterized protein YbjT (DUF2867 family)